MTAFLIVGIIVLALVGAPMFAVLGAFAVLGFGSLNYAFAPEGVLALATGAGAATLSTIPLFTFMGYILAESKTADRLVGCAKALVGWLPGGLAIVTIFTCALFTTFTGASGVTIVAVGSLIMPALIKEGYKERFALGLVTGTGSIGLLIPPALPLIVYGIVYGMSAQASSQSSGDTMTLVDFSVERFLFAGVVPGLILCGAVGIWAVWRALRDKVPTTKFEPKLAWTATVRALPELAIPVVMILTLVTGWLQIPEAAAVTCLYVILVETVYYKDIKLRQLPKIASEAMRLVGAIFVLIVAATALTNHFVNDRIPDRLYAWMDAHIHSQWAFLLALNVLLLAVGSVMDIFSAILVVVPLIAPAAARYGIDPYHLGVVFLLNLEIGYVHPPVGLNLFISSYRFGKEMVELYKAIIPIIVIMLGTLILVTYVPALTPIKAKTVNAGGAPTAPGAVGIPDAGVGEEVKISFKDGGVWTPKRCEAPTIKDDPLALAECTAMFKLWPKCEKLSEPLDRLECEQKVIDGEDPFTADAGAK